MVEMGLDPLHEPGTELGRNEIQRAGAFLRPSSFREQALLVAGRLGEPYPPGTQPGAQPQPVQDRWG